MLIRELIEKLERETLSEYATCSADSRGRLVPEEKCPIRTDFQRDRDRIIHASKAFRRLSHKTQVFLSPEEDHYRTRLSHTLEVAQIARTIAKALRLNEELTEAIALAHDLGHAPFGHAGEDALDEAYRQYDPAAHFRHQEQSLRVVDCLEKDGQGLNLTWEVRDGILLHTKGRQDFSPSSSDRQPATLEGHVVRIADRIAYVNHDIDDALRAGLLTLDDLPQDCLTVLGRRHSERVSTMVGDLVRHSLNQPRLSMSVEVMEASNRLKDFLFDHLYLSARLQAERERVVGLIHQLFGLYMEHPELMPAVRDSAQVEEPRARARLVCDYIAGMTDRYAKQQYITHFLPHDWKGA